MTSILLSSSRIIKKGMKWRGTNNNGRSSSTNDNNTSYFVSWFARRFQLMESIKELIFQNNNNNSDKIKNDDDDEINSNNNNVTTTTISNEQQQQEDLQQLRENCPESYDEERIRFLRAKNGNVSEAIIKLKEYLLWRKQHNLDSLEYQARLSTLSDEQEWYESCILAQRYYQENNKKKKKKKKSKINSNTILPQIIFVYNNKSSTTTGSNALQTSITTKDGSLVLHFIPNRIDLKLADIDTYTLTIGLYLDRKFDRKMLGHATLLMDVGFQTRSLMPFLKSTSNLLHRYYPERLYRCFLYAIPKSALWIWDMLQPFLDNNIKNSIHLLNNNNNTIPFTNNEVLLQFIDQECLDIIEQNNTSRLLLQE